MVRERTLLCPLRSELYTPAAERFMWLRKVVSLYQASKKVTRLSALMFNSKFLMICGSRSKKHTFIKNLFYEANCFGGMFYLFLCKHMGH